MKKIVCFALAIVMVFALCGCEKKDVDLYSTGESWAVGFGREEIAYDQPVSQYYMAGYHNNWKPIGQLDVQRASAVWLETGGKAVLLMSIDCIALASGEVQKIENRLADLLKENSCQLFVSATHTHAGADTLGLWGEVARDGKDEAFMSRLFEAAEKAARTAFEDRQEGKLYFGKTRQGIEELPYDSREPTVCDKNLYQLRFVPEKGGEGIRVVNYGAHAESLRGDNRFLSADYPYYLCETVEQETDDRCMFLQGAIGGLIMTEILRNEIGTEYISLDNVKETGKLLAKAALSITEERELPPILGVQTAEISIPVDNGVFVAMKALGILNNQISYSGEGEYGLSVRTQVGRVVLGDLSLATIPGELFPELAYGGADTGVGCMADFAGEEFLVIGLCNDEIGYIVAPDNYLLNPDKPYLDKIEDETGENHYEETNSVSVYAAEAILEAERKLFEK